MKVARFWTRDRGEALNPDGSRIRVTARGWSDVSLDEARRRAREVAAKLAAALAAGSLERGHYLYGDRPLPEPILSEFGDRAVVTRNAYGSVVLNARSLMFVDIDREDAPASPPPGGRVAGLMSLFGKPQGEAAPRPPGVADHIRAIGERNGLSGRIYRTAAGFRALVSNAPFDPAGQATDGLLRQFGSDPLYIRLCRAQESFRARLGPKPWRVKVGVPPVSFPFDNPKDEARFREWQAKYDRAAQSYATCRYVGEFGRAAVSAEFEDLIRYHDEQTRANSDFSLA